MVIKILMGPKEKEFYEKRAAARNGWTAEDIIFEELDMSFYDMVQDSPHGICYTDMDVNFNEEDAKEILKEEGIDNV